MTGAPDLCSPAPIATPERLQLLRIARIDVVARDIQAFELVAADGALLPPFSAGAHVTVRTPFGATRKYSLCNDPAERHRYVIAVKRVASGRGGSVSMHQDLRVGDSLPVSLPQSAFALVDEARAHLFIAGGIGITPILSMIRSLATAAMAPWRLVYLSRTEEDAAFLDELRRAGDARSVIVHHDQGDPLHAFDLWPLLERPNSAHVYCCGPMPLMEAVRDMTGHWSHGWVHFESFSDGGSSGPQDRPFTAVLARSGTELAVPVGQTILGVLREHGHAVASSCESGTCGTCRTRLLGGQADHRDMVLLDEEKSEQVMICVSRAKTDRLVLDL